VDPRGEAALAGAALASDQHARVRARGAAREIEHGLHGAVARAGDHEARGDTG
jgi:hypothetical protein